MDSRSLQVVEQGEGEAGAVSELRGIDDVRIHKVRRSSLQTSFGIGVNAAFRELDIGVHIGAVCTDGQVFDYFFAYLRLDTGCKTVFDIAPAYLSPKSGEELRKTML